MRGKKRTECPRQAAQPEHGGDMNFPVQTQSSAHYSGHKGLSLARGDRETRPNRGLQATWVTGSRVIMKSTPLSHNPYKALTTEAQTRPLCSVLRKPSIGSMAFVRVLPGQALWGREMPGGQWGGQRIDRRGLWEGLGGCRPLGGGGRAGGPWAWPGREGQPEQWQ